MSDLYQLLHINSDIVLTLCMKLPKDHVLSIWTLKSHHKCVEEVLFLFMDVNAVQLVMIQIHQLQDVQQDALS